MTRKRLLIFLVTLITVGVIFFTVQKQPNTEVSKIRVATQFGLAYLPLIIMEHDKLWEKRAKEHGIEMTVEYTRLGGGAALNDALLSGSVDLAAGGLTPMITIWDKTQSGLEIKGLSAINSSPMDILTNKPNVKKLVDLSPTDKIAVPAIRTSIQALGLNAASRRELGPDQFAHFDSQTVAMQHPDALAALLQPNGPIAAYVSSSPYQERALKNPAIHKITDSFEAFGGPSTFAVAYVRNDFVKKQPKITTAYYEAFQDALDLIKKDKNRSIDKYIAVTNDGTSRELLLNILSRPDFTFSEVPSGTVKMATLMKETKLIKSDVSDWKTLFVEPLHNRKGS